MNLRVSIPLLCATLFCAFQSGCNDLPDAPTANTRTGDQLPTWDEVTPSTHTKASRPPEPVLIVDRKANKCFKVYSIFPQEYRLPNGQAYSIRNCEDDCGSLIACPGWAQDVQSDFSQRAKRKEAAKIAPDPQEAPEPATETPDETKPASAKTNWPGRLGPPPTEAPKEESVPSKDAKSPKN